MFIAKTQLNYTRKEFFDSTFKELIDMIEELNSYNERVYGKKEEQIDNENYSENNNSEVISIEELSFL
ncbi:MAG: hypothetical protein ACRCVJ_12080 [Clostridium sp.]